MFDPDKYLAEKSAPAFDPDAYLNSKGPPAPKVESAPTERSLGSNALRQLGLTARHGLEGVGSVADSLAYPIRYGLNKIMPSKQTMSGLVTGEQPQPTISGNTGAYVANKLGLPSPENPTERVVGDITQAMAGTGGLAGGANAIATQAPKAALPVLNFLAANQGTQALASAGAGGGSGIARESGAGPVGQAIAGLAGAVSVPTAVGGAKIIGEKLGDIGATVGASFGNKTGVNRLASDAVTRAAGDKRDALVAALRNPTEYVPGAKPTVAEAITEANMGRPDQFGGAIVKLQKDLSGAKGIEDILPSHAKSQQAALEAPIIEMAGGTTAKQRAKSLSSGEELRDRITAPMRAQALSKANIGGIKIPELESAIAYKTAQSRGAVEDVRRLSLAGEKAQTLGESGVMRLDKNAPPVSGLPRLSSRYSYGEELSGLAERKASDAAGVSLRSGAERRALEDRIGTLADHGLKPLDGGRVVGHIDRILERPGEGIVTLNQKVLGAVRDKIAEAVEKRGGRLDAEDLYAIRKTEINDVVKGLTKDLDASTKNRAATLVTSIKGSIDDAIEASGGSGWKNYLKEYASASNELDQMKVAGAVLEKMRSDSGKATPAQLLKVLGSGEESLLKNSMGGPRATDIEQVFKSSPEKAEMLRAIEKHMQRSEEAARISSGIKSSSAGEMVSGEIPKPPALLSRPTMLANYLLKMISGGAEPHVAKRVAESMRDPKDFAKLLAERKIPIGQRSSESAKRAALAAALQEYQ